MMAAAMGEEAGVPVWDEVQQLCWLTDLKYKGDDGGSHGCYEAEMLVCMEIFQLLSITVLMVAAMDEEAEVQVWKEVHQLCSVTDLKYKGDNGDSHV
jgi:hypothetical protein